jgi:hypothetical protein
MNNSKGASFKSEKNLYENDFHLSKNLAMTQSRKDISFAKRSFKENSD